MAINKVLEIDLTQLTQESAKNLVSEFDEIIKETTQKKKSSSTKKLKTAFDKRDAKIEKRMEKLKKELKFDLVNGKGKDSLKSKLFGKQDFSKGGITKNIVKFGLNPGGMVGGLLKVGIPGFGAAVAATAIMVAILKKFDELEKKFTDDIRTKLNAERDNEQTARIQAGLAQEIFTAGPGTTDPRDAYNTFDEFNNNQQRIETDYAIRTSSGVE